MGRRELAASRNSSMSTEIPRWREECVASGEGGTRGMGVARGEGGARGMEVRE